DRNDESDRQVKLGKDAFKAGEYGRAAERFRQAVTAAADRPMPHFLLAQAEFALGRYREAVVAIHDGLKRRPDWPTGDFKPRDLYGKVADYPADLERLGRAVARQPEDAALLFLYGYQLWFDGRRPEARTHLEKALPLVADPAPLRRFLDTPPP